MYDLFNMFLKHSSSLPERSLLGTLVLGDLLNPAAANRGAAVTAPCPPGPACCEAEPVVQIIHALSGDKHQHLCQKWPSPHGQGVGPGCDGHCIPVGCPGASLHGRQQDRDTFSHADTELAPSLGSKTTLRDGLKTPCEVFAQQQTVTQSGKLLMGIVCLHNVELTSCCYSDKENFLSSDEIQENKQKKSKQWIFLHHILYFWAGIIFK